MEVKGQLTSQHYAQIEEMNQRHAEILHSMAGRLKVLEHLAKKDQNQEIIRILSAMNQDIQDSSQQVYSSHPILNAILNEKRKEAEAARVDYQVEVELGFRPPRRLEKDLITILCNLIDNAVEAASCCDKGYVRMLFYTNNDGKFKGIRIENNYSREPVLKKDGSFLTSKADPTLHGIGVKHVKRLVEKAEGIFQVRYEAGVFVASILISEEIGMGAEGGRKP